MLNKFFSSQGQVFSALNNSLHLTTARKTTIKYANTQNVYKVAEPSFTEPADKK